MLNWRRSNQLKLIKESDVRFVAIGQQIANQFSYNDNATNERTIGFNLHEGSYQWQFN